MIRGTATKKELQEELDGIKSKSTCVKEEIASKEQKLMHIERRIQTNQIIRAENDVLTNEIAELKFQKLKFVNTLENLKEIKKTKTYDAVQEKKAYYTAKFDETMAEYIKHRNILKESISKEKSEIGNIKSMIEKKKSDSLVIQDNIQEINEKRHKKYLEIQNIKEQIYNMNKKTTQLQEEKKNHAFGFSKNKEIPKIFMCLLCNKQLRQICFMPCGCFDVCVKCFKKMKKQQINICIFCDQEIKDFYYVNYR